MGLPCPRLCPRLWPRLWPVLRPKPAISEMPSIICAGLLAIIAALDFTVDTTSLIHEFDASTLETVGAPSKGHTSLINTLALSSDRVLLVSTSYDHTIKLWAFESRQLLASFDVKSLTFTIVLSPDSRQLAYTNWNDCNIYICNIPANILASIGLAEEPQPSVCIPR